LSSTTAVQNGAGLASRRSAIRASPSTTRRTAGPPWRDAPGFDWRAGALLDPDDRLRLDALGRLWSALDADPTATVAYGRAARIDVDGRTMGLWHRPIATPEPSGRVLGVLLRHNFIRCPGAALIRSSCFERTHPFDPAAFPGADWELWCRLANLGPFAALRGAPVVDYRTHPSSITLGLAEAPCKAMRPIALVYDNPSLVGQLSPARRTALRRKREASMYAWLATECLRAGDTTRASRLFLMGLQCSRWNLRLRTLWLFARAGRRPPWF
jgi:hypothetical protein